MTAKTATRPRAAAKRPAPKPDPKPSVKAKQDKTAAAIVDALNGNAKPLDIVASVKPEKPTNVRKGKGTISTPGEKAPDLYESVKDVPSVPSTEKAAKHRVDRMRLAKAEFAALKAWKLAGAKAPRPATPNLDAINAGNTGSSKSTTTTPRASLTISGFALVDRGLPTITCCTCKTEKPGKVFPTRGKTHRSNECRECGAARRSS